jgi:hypothetical protein
MSSRCRGSPTNTLVIFTSDNGPPGERLGGTDSDFFQSAGPLRGRKGSAYEGGFTEPFIASWSAKIKGGHESNFVGGFRTSCRRCASWRVPRFRRTSTPSASSGRYSARRARSRRITLRNRPRNQGGELVMVRLLDQGHRQNVGPLTPKNLGESSSCC